MKVASLGRFAAVGRDDRRAAILRVILALWIGENGLAGVRTSGNDLRKHAVGQQAFCIIGNNDRVRVSDAFVNTLGEKMFGLGRKAFVRLVIDPRDLLAVGDDAGLDGRGTVGGSDNVLGGHADAVEDLSNQVRFGVISNNPKRSGVAPRPATLTATLAAPPAARLVSLSLTIGTGASGEMRLTSPHQ